MKKIFTLFVVCAMVMSLNAQLKVGYYGLNKSATGTAAMDAGAQNDPVLAMLQADTKLTVTVNLVNATGDAAPAGWNDYDVVILQESIGSANQLVKDLNLLAVTKPYLINKSYAFKAGSLFTTGTGSGKEASTDGTTVAGASYSYKVETGAATNDLFKGCSIVNDTINIFKYLSNDLGVTTGTAAFKGLNYATGVTSTGGTLLASPYNFPAASPVAICVSTFLSGGTIASSTFTNKVITLGMNYGAICAGTTATVPYTNISNNGLTIWRNAVYILGGLTVPNYSVSSQIAKTAKLSYIRNGNQITVNLGTPQNATVSVYNLGGSLIAKKVVNSNMAIIDLDGKANGIYIVKVSGAKVNGTQKFSIQ
jgi:hypothetical protein